MPPPPAKDLIARLPRTFGPALREKLNGWDLLFPAEKRLLKAQLDWLAGLPENELRSLMQPVNAIEAKMDLAGWKEGAVGLTIADTAQIARSPYYPQWRGAVETVFERVDNEVESTGELPRLSRLVVNVLPEGLPMSGQVLWNDLAAQGKWVTLDTPFGRIEDSFVAQLANRRPPSGLESVEALWVFECGSRFAGGDKARGATFLSWGALEKLRRKFLDRLNSIQKNLKSADDVHEELRRLDIRSFLDQALGLNPPVREFIRSLLLSGNGSLVFNNSFVQWGASEALRRVQPQVLIASFGIRTKPKPFSSLVWFEDQTRSNPTPDQPDPEGSLTDGQMLSEYVLLAAQRLAPYHDRTLFVMAAETLDRILVLMPPESTPFPTSIKGAELSARALQWLGATA